MLTEQTQVQETEENNKHDDMSEPIYMNVTGRKQTSPVKLEDLHGYILKNKDNNSDGFRKEFEVCGVFEHVCQSYRNIFLRKFSLIRQVRAAEIGLWLKSFCDLRWYASLLCLSAGLL